MSNQSIIEAGQQYLMNTYGRLPLAVVRGQGARIWDADGKEYLDFVAGIAVNSLGHNHPALSKAISEQADKVLHVSNLYWIEPQVELAKLLVENSCCDKVFFANSGAEANEGAIKLARKYARLNGGEDKFEIITMQRSFHGRTLATLAATGQDKFHRDFNPLPSGFQYVPFNDLAALEKAIGPKTCAVMLEPVQGEGGVYAADPDYLKGVRQLCNEKGVLLIFDEVQCGIGRIGELFAYKAYGVEPDIITLAKGLGGGVPVGAFLATDKVAAAFQPGDHGSTFGGNPLVTAAAGAVLKTVLGDGFLDGVKEVSSYFRARLAELAGEFSCVKEVRGKGLLLGMELTVPAAGVVNDCRENGLLINGVAEKVLRFLPPLIVTKADVDEAVNILRKALLKLA